MWDWIGQLRDLQNQGQPIVIVTVTQVSGATPREPGSKMLVIPGGTFWGTIGGGHLEALALNDAKILFQKPQVKIFRYPLGAMTGQCCGGVVEVLMEVVNSGPKLYLFGAGHVGQAVCRTLVGTPFQVHLIDERPEWIQSEKLPKEIQRHPCSWTDFASSALWDKENTFVAIMTHEHTLDQSIVEYVVQKPTRYVGLIGSPSKWARFKKRLSVSGLDDTLISKVKCPIGIDIGGKAPQEVAISLAAELLTILNRRPSINSHQTNFSTHVAN